MEMFGRVLLWLGDAATWCGGMIAAAAGNVWGFLSAVLQPVLSPILGALNPLATSIGDAYYSLFGASSPLVGLVVTSVLTGVVMLIAFRYTSNQDGIARVKDTIKAELLAIKLYKDDLRVMFTSQGRLISATLRLQWYMLKPLMIMLMPMLMLLAQMGARYQQRPVAVGEPVIVSVIGGTSDATLTGSGVSVEVGPIEGDGDLAWRVRALDEDRHQLMLHVGGQTIEKSLCVGRSGQPVNAQRSAGRWTSRLLYPRESPIDTQTEVQAITVKYPELDSWVYGTDWWVLTFFAVSMLTAILLKPVFRVKF